MSKFIPLSVPNLSGNELEYVTDAVKTEWVSSAGSAIVEFEKNFAAYTGTESACACQSGTAGLHLCLRHFGITPNDIVIVPTLTFIATINAVMYQFARPVFIDCDEHLCIDVAQIKEYIENNCEFDGDKLFDVKQKACVKAIIPVHVFGETCDMDGIMELAGKYHLVVIEDATESLGTKFESGSNKGKHTGTVGHAGVCSFNGNKIITTGGGGMIVSHDADAMKHMRYLSQQAKDDLVYFVHNEVGYNYRMTNLQAALGLAQLEQLDMFIETKRKNFIHYREKLGKCKFGQLLPFKSISDSNCWFYSFCLTEESAETRDDIIEYMSKAGIQTRPVWKLNHLQEPFLEYFAMPCGHAQAWYNRIINLPCSTNLTSDDVDTVCEALLQYPLQSKS